VARTSTDDGRRRREEILDTAASRFAADGYHGTSVRDLAAACRIQPASLYAHFDGKEQILEELIRRYLDALVPALQAAASGSGKAATRLARMVEVSIELALAHRSEFLLFSTHWNQIFGMPALTQVLEGTQECRRLWLRVLEEGAHDGSLHADLDRGQVVRVLFGAILGMIDTAYDDMVGTASPQAAVTAIAVLLDGLARSRRSRNVM
jgi:AcrR family transcriptional regulator